MSSPTYIAFGMIPADSDFDFDVLIGRLRAALPGFAFDVQERSAHLRKDGFKLEVGVEGQPHVIEESREIASMLGADSKAQAVASCPRRVVISSHTADPDMVYFRDFVFAQEHAERFKGVILVDPRGPELI